MDQLKKALNKTKKIFINILETDILIYSGAVSFYSIFSLIPFLILALTLFSYFPMEFKDFIEGQLGLLKSKELESSLLTYINKLEALELTKVNSISSLALLLFTSTGLINFLQRCVNRIFNEKRGKNIVTMWLLRRFVSSALIMTGIFIAFLLIVLSSFINSFLSLDNVFYKFLALTQPFLFLMLTLYIAIQYLPAKSVKVKYALLSAFICSLFFVIVNHYFAFYLSHLNYIKLLAETKALIIIMLWIFLHSTIFLGSLVLAKTLQDEMDEGSEIDQIS